MSNPFEPPLRITWQRTVTEDFERTVDLDDLPSHIEHAYRRGEEVDWAAWAADEELDVEPVRHNVDQRIQPTVTPLVRGVCMTCEWATDFYPTERIVDAMLEHHMASTHGA